MINKLIEDLIRKKLDKYKIYILGLSDGWGGDINNEKFKEEHWNRVESILNEMFSFLDGYIQIPNILPCNDNDIWLVWRNGKYKMVISIPEDPEEGIQCDGWNDLDKIFIGIVGYDFQLNIRKVQTWLQYKLRLIE